VSDDQDDLQKKREEWLKKELELASAVQELEERAAEGPALREILNKPSEERTPEEQERVQLFVKLLREKEAERKLRNEEVTKNLVSKLRQEGRL